MKKTLFIGISLLTLAALAQNKIELPTEQNRKILFEQVVGNLNRVDGDGLIPFVNRPESWDRTTEKLKQEAIQAKNLFEFGRVFKRLDAAYPNLHAKVYLLKNLDQNKTDGKIRFPFKLRPDLNSPDKSTYRYFINVDEKNSPKTELKNGDELLEINGLGIDKFQENSFIFCKFPFRSQCALELFDNLRFELLGWSRDQDLIITVKRKNETLKFKAVPEIVA